MKLYVVLILFFVYVNLVSSYPNRGTVQTREKSSSPSTTTVIGSKPAGFDSSEFTRLALSCVPEEVWSVVKSCQEEIISKLNTTTPATTMTGPLTEQSIDELEDSKSGELHDEENEFETINVVSKCILKKSGTVDDVTGQFDMARYTKTFENTSLSREQKSSTIASFKSCITANLIAPSSTIFIHWKESANEAIKNVNGNFISASHTLMCDIISLIKNGCSDASISNSALVWVVHEIQMVLDKENDH